MRFLLMIGRLQPGTSVPAAQAELHVLSANLALSDPSSNRNITSLAFPASRAKFWPAYRSAITRAVSVFAIAAGLVLLLACANVSNLLLGRTIGRRREISIRLSLGAPRSRLIRQLLTENLLLALGFSLSLAVTRLLQGVLLHFPTALGLPLALDLAIDRRAFFYCAALSLLTSLLLGLAPALQATRPDILPVLKESGSQASAPSGFLLRSSLIAVQVAFSLTLLVAGGLFMRSLLKAYATDPGFRSTGLWVGSFDASSESKPVIQRAVERVSALPQVASATIASSPPLDGIDSSVEVTPEETKTPTLINHNEVGPRFLETLGIPLVRGRDFTSRDDAARPKVAIVNETMAKDVWPASEPLGSTILVAGKTTYIVVGVARDAKYKSVWEQSEPYFYLAAYQSQTPSSNLIVHARAGVAVSELRRQWDGFTRRAPVFDWRSGSEIVNRSLAPQRLSAFLLTAFSALAVLLAVVGLFSVTSYTVAQRTREIGVRLAVGATPREVVSHILFTAFRPVAIGLLLGLAVSAAVMKLAAANANQVSPYDPITYLAVVSLLVMTSAAAICIPALGVARIDPATALKS